MKSFFVALALLMGASNVYSSTLEVQVSGLNCSYCSEKMKDALKKAAQADDIEPKLECGAIYLSSNMTPQETERLLRWTLASNGFNLKQVVPSDKTMDEVRTLEC